MAFIAGLKLLGKGWVRQGSELLVDENVRLEMGSLLLRKSKISYLPFRIKALGLAQDCGVNLLVLEGNLLGIIPFKLFGESQNKRDRDLLCDSLMP